ncbi:hypothetical protein ACXR2T_02940 [Leucobacter sp. HY1910]
MEIVKGILVVLHIVGFGVVFGGALAQLPRVKEGAAKISAGMMHGAWLLLATGLLLVGMTYALGGKPDNAKIGVKLIVLLAIIVLVLINRKKPQVSGGIIGALAGLSAVNVAIAVLWS